MRRLTWRRLALGGGAAAGLALLAAGFGLATGPSHARLDRALAALLDRVRFGGVQALFLAPQSFDEQVIWLHRAPRVLAGALVGALLSGAGVALQALLRNPLADPFILGVSGGAVLGAAAVALLGGVALAHLVPWGAFCGALAVAFLIYALGRRVVGSGGTGLLLAGVVVNAVLSSWILLLSFVVDPSERLRLIAWLTGNLGAFALTPSVLALASLGALIVWVTLQWCARSLDLLALGDDVARTLGVSLVRLRTVLFFTASLATGIAVAISGLVGFVGLIVPHAVRLVVGADHRLLLPVSMCVGAALLVVSDALARTAFAPAEVPVGVITSLLGGPFFLWLLSRPHRSLLEVET